MPRIFDNIDLKLRDGLIQTLQASGVTRLDAAIGYFNMRGWSVLRDVVDELPLALEPRTVRLIIGMQGRPEDDIRRFLRTSSADDMDNQTAQRLRETAVADLKRQLEIGYPQANDRQTLRILRRQLAEGRVRVKLFLRSSLHAKLYLRHRDDVDNPRTGFVGSSNLTFSGLSGQGELNVDVLEQDATEKLHRWFEDRWSDRFCIDITDDLIEIIDTSWSGERVVLPYLIHLKIAYFLSEDAREGLIQFGLPQSLQAQLLEYQSAAVRITARNLLTRGGAMIGDVVGLGKTLVATAIALLLQEERSYETLIICPKNLVPMWESYKDTHRLHGRVVSLSMVHQELPDLRRHRLVIIDESHNLRNAKRRDYQAIRSYIERNDPKVLLLTATPFNTSMNDVASQLRVFLDEDADLGIRPEAAIDMMDSDQYNEFLRRCEDRPSSLKAFERSEETEDWQRLLAQFLVRRTRKFIEDNYAERDEDDRPFLKFVSGERFYLPKRQPRPITFVADDSDPASLMESDEVFVALDSLRLPRYDLAAYLRDDDVVHPSPSEQETLDDLLNASGNLIGFTRTMLLKRLSSSGAVFGLSLQRHLLRNHIYLRAISESGFLPVGSVSDEQILGDSDERLIIPLSDTGNTQASLLDPIAENAPTDRPRSSEDWGDLAGRCLAFLEHHNPSGVKWLNASLFGADLREALEHDAEVLQNLLDRFGLWDHLHDSKLEALYDLVANTHAHEKILIFSEYADTAEYVTKALQLRGVARVHVATGDSENPTLLARRFSPMSNAELGPTPPPEDDIRVLVATDVLSEGQNLQDCHIVVNFDLPWAIVKLIQRAGRVDRIGQQHPTVDLYTFLPSSGVDSVLKLRSRVAARLARNAAIFGSDEGFFGDPNETRIIRALFDENADFSDETQIEEVDYTSAAFEIWRRALEATPNLAEQARLLPDVTGTTMASSSSRTPGVMVFTRSEQGFDRVGFASPTSPAVRLSPLDALRLTTCVPETPAAPEIENQYDLMAIVVDGPLAVDDLDPEMHLTGIRKRAWQRVMNLLDSHEAGKLFDPDADSRAALESLRARPLTEQAKQSLSRALRDRTPQDLLALVTQLHLEERLTVKHEANSDVLRIICSMGLVGGSN
jgi:superfamily II DNA or RNA helicase